MENVFESINKAGEKIDDVAELVSSKREFISKQILNIGLVFIVLVATGCLDFMHPSVHLEKIFELSFWSSITGKLIAGVCMFNLGINLFWDSVIKRNKTLTNAILEYKKLILYKQIDFEYFIVKIFNCFFLVITRNYY